MNFQDYVQRSAKKLPGIGRAIGGALSSGYDKVKYGAIDLKDWAYRKFGTYPITEEYLVKEMPEQTIEAQAEADFNYWPLQHADLLQTVAVDAAAAVTEQNVLAEVTEPAVAEPVQLFPEPHAPIATHENDDNNGGDPPPEAA